MEHFGIKITKRKYSLNINREEYALINTKPSLPKFESLIKYGAYANEEGTEYAEEWCVKYRDICLKNYDLNMRYFESLDPEEFNEAICTFLKQYRKFKEVKDLHEYNDRAGYYVMVLDEYHQAYIGKSNDIKRRIQQHWSKTKAFDRVLLPMYNEKSTFSIDFFRALDTTRIFVWERTLSEGIERKLVKSFPRKFLCNRIGGDVETLGQAIETINKHDL